MDTNLPAVRLSQFSVETATKSAESIRALVRLPSPVLATACRQAGLSVAMSELCGGLLASVVDDLVQIGRLRRSDFERTKRKQRVLVAAQEPALHALRIAIAASPVNGTAVAHWDAIAEPYEIGKLAWLLGMDTEMAYAYGRRQRNREKRGCNIS